MGDWSDSPRLVSSLILILFFFNVVVNIFKFSLLTEL